MTKVSIVILNWNHAEDTLECLKSVKGLKAYGFELLCVVVDNGSKDDSVKRITYFIDRENKAHQREISWRIIGTDVNRGFAGGNNFGIKYSLEEHADFIVILNNDTIVDKNLVKGLIETAVKHPTVGIISPKIYFAEGYEFHKERYQRKDQGRVIWYAGGSMDWNNIYGSNRGVDEVDNDQYDKVEETDFATGACMMLSRQAVVAAGLFDEKYYLYLEDADLSQRMKKKGFDVIYSPKGHLWHKVSQSSGIGSSLNDYFITRNRFLFGMRYASLRTRFALYKESIRLMSNGREWQKWGVLDFYLRNFGKGSWING